MVNQMVLPPFGEYLFFSSTLSKAKGMKMFLGFFATKLPPNEEKPLQTCGGKKVREIFPPKMHFYSLVGGVNDFLLSPRKLGKMNPF